MPPHPEGRRAPFDPATSAFYHLFPNKGNLDLILNAC